MGYGSPYRTSVFQVSQGVALYHPALLEYHKVMLRSDVLTQAAQQGGSTTSKHKGGIALHAALWRVSSVCGVVSQLWYRLLRFSGPLSTTPE